MKRWIRFLEKYAVLKVSEEQYQAVDKRYLLKEKKELFWSCLSDEREAVLYRKLSGNRSRERITRSGDSDVDRGRKMMKGIRGLLEKDFRLFFRQGGNLFWC